jgi:predicted transcriptional regulator
MRSVTSTIRLDSELLRRVGCLAKERGISKNRLIVDMITERLAESEEQAYRERLRRQARKVAEKDRTNPDVEYFLRVAEEARSEWWGQVK